MPVSNDRPVPELFCLYPVDENENKGLASRAAMRHFAYYIAKYDENWSNSILEWVERAEELVKARKEKPIHEKFDAYRRKDKTRAIKICQIVKSDSGYYYLFPKDLNIPRIKVLSSWFKLFTPIAPGYYMVDPEGKDHWLCEKEFETYYEKVDP